MALDVSALTDQGSRDHNEDFYGLPPADLTPEQVAAKGLLYLVADGVGGHQAGDVASHLAVETVQQLYYADLNPDVGVSLQVAIEEANRRIYHQAVSNSQQYGMGTTLTAVVLRGNEALVANVGDSRTYLIRDGQASQLTQDHTWVAEAQADGLLTAQEARDHPRRNVITRSLGNNLQVQVDVFAPQPLQAGDSLVLCSDGLSGVVEDAEIASIVGQSRDAAQAAGQLVALTKRRGAPDNVTTLLIGVGHKRAVAAPRNGIGPAPVLVALLGLAVLVTALIVAGGRFFGRPSNRPAGAATEIPTLMPAGATAIETPTPTVASATATPLSLGALGLTLQAPDEGAEFLAGDEVTLRWTSRDLGAEERFRVQVQRDGDALGLPGDGVTQGATELALPAETLTPGEYRWWVTVERERAGGWDLLDRTLPGGSFTILRPTPTPLPPPTWTPLPTPTVPPAVSPTDPPAPPPQCREVCDTCTRTVTDPVTGAVKTEEYPCNCRQVCE